jgi:hypothetical protein
VRKKAWRLGSALFLAGLIWSERRSFLCETKFTLTPLEPLKSFLMAALCVPVASVVRIQRTLKGFCYGHLIPQLEPKRPGAIRK